MLDFILWYLLVSLVGLAAFPLAFRLFTGLSERGYAFSRSLGLLIWGFLFWMLASLGVIRNNPGGLLLTFGFLLGLSWLAWRGIDRVALADWWRQEKKTVLAVEVLFLGAFAAWSLVRAANPEIAGTEKPMELAFINAILRSPVFPPHDPWLSGYAISYYYFGYVLVAMLAQATATPGVVAFNLALALVFALVAIGAYGLVYNLLREWKGRGAEGQPRGGGERFSALLGPFFILILGNLEGFLHSLHNRGLFWHQDASGAWVSSFWKWLDMKELSLPPAQPFSWVPTEHWWWWRASRVIQDYDLSGRWKEIIDEFPFFSFLLGDLHPHVLAMPFALLAVALALNLFLGGGRGQLSWLQRRIKEGTLVWIDGLLLVGGMLVLIAGLKGLSLGVSLAGLAGFLVGLVLLPRAGLVIRKQGPGVLTSDQVPSFALGLPLYISPGYFILSALALGGLAFLNTWDFPIYVALFCGAYLIGRVEDWKTGRLDETVNNLPIYQFIKEFLFLALALGISGVILYLPFYLGFSSQAGGILPNLIYVTRGAHLWVMFGGFFFFLLAYLVFLFRRYGNREYLRRAAGLALALLAVLLVLALLLGVGIAALPGVGEIYLDSVGALGQNGELMREALLCRIIAPGAWITLAILLTLSLALLWVRKPSLPARPVSTGRRMTPAHIFALLLVLFGTLLVIGPEFFFLRDQFGWRMNTVFKFYYQAWILWGLAAAFGTAVLLRELPRRWNLAFSLGMAVVLVMALVYPLLSLWNKTSGFSPPGGLTLDGTPLYVSQSADEMAAIQWLQAAPAGVVVEAVGGSYSSAARVAMLSGQPDVLGWPGHELQWRGGAKEMGSRESDIQTLYQTGDWTAANDILQRYGVRYVYVGGLERSTYRVNEAKFQRFLKPVFQQGQVSIYEVPQEETATLQESLP